MYSGGVHHHLCQFCGHTSRSGAGVPSGVFRYSKRLRVDEGFVQVEREAHYESLVEKEELMID